MKYKSRSLLMPIAEDGQLLHQSVLAALSAGEDIPVEDKKFCYKVTRSPKIEPLQLVEAKGVSLPVQCNPLDEEIKLANGDCLNLTVNLSTCRTIDAKRDGEKVINDDGRPKRKDVFIDSRDKQTFETLLTTLLLNIGLEFIRCSEVGPLLQTKIEKPKHKFFIRHCKVSLTATVIDFQKAEAGIVAGIGKHKSYGFGFITLDDQF